MIPEFPVGAGQVFDVWAHGDEATAGGEAAEGFFEGFAESGFIREMLEEIAGENELEGIVGELPVLGTILLEEGDVFVEILQGVVVEVHGVFFGALDLVDEFAVAAAEIEDVVGGFDVLLEKILEENGPNLLAIRLVLAEAGAVDFFEFGWFVGAHFFL
jgi:hypothetical protein